MPDPVSSWRSFALYQFLRNPSYSRHSIALHAPALSPSILADEGNMPSTSSGEGPSSSPEIPTTDKLLSYLDIAAQCLKRVQEMSSRKFNNEQCGYLDAKLKALLRSATFFLFDPGFVTSEDVTRCVEVFKLLLALALKIESFVQNCCKEGWLQAAMTLTNTGAYVSSLGFNLELCEVYFMGRRVSRALTAAQVDDIERNEVEVVNRKASVDVDVLLHKVISQLSYLRGQDKDLAIYLLQRLVRVKPVPTSLSPESPFWSGFDDWGFLGRIFQLVRQTESLGKGTSAIVHKALWLGTPVAKKTFYGPEHPDYLREVQILGGLCHPNIMSMFCCAMDKRKCSIVMELMDEDLHSFMQRRLDANPHSLPFSVFEAIDVILQIGEGVHYLHQNGIVHRDLKSFNILVKNVLPTDLEVQYVLIKVADFGFAKIKESSTRYSNQTLNIGTNRWMPPEVINFHHNDGQTSASVLPEGPKYPKKSDVYSFGMVCYEVLTGDVPFPQETSLINIKKKVLKGERPRLPDYCPSILKALIEECWDPEPTHRPSFASICSSLKHLKSSLMSGFLSNEDFHVKIGEPLQIEAPTREMIVRKRPVEEGLHHVLSNALKKSKGAAMPSSGANSFLHSGNGDDTREPLQSSEIPCSSPNITTCSTSDDFEKLIAVLLEFESPFAPKEDPALVSSTGLKQKISDEESHVKIGELLQMSPENSPFEAPTREMIVRKRPVEEGLRHVLSNAMKKSEAAAMPSSRVNSSLQR